MLDTRTEPTAADFRNMQNNPEFKELKSKFRSFTFPMSVAFFVWYIGFVALATYMPDFMGQQIFGLFNVGMLLGVLQFVTTFAITAAYIKFANKQIEPRAKKIRQMMEG